MNKKDIILIIGVLLIILVAIFVTGGDDENKIKLPVSLSGEETGVVSIDYETYESKIKNGDNFIVVIERTGCNYCEMYAPIVKEVAEELKVPVYDINLADLSEEEYLKLEESNTYLKRNNWGTPTTLLLSGNRVLASLGGYVEKDEFTSFIKSNVIMSSNEETNVE